MGIMKALSIQKKAGFIGREYELNLLNTIGGSGEASIIIMYGRRRIGKTELLEQAFRNRNILKFEGIEGLAEVDQLKHAVKQLAGYVGDVFLDKLVLESWGEFFQLLAKYTEHGQWTIYLEELQWLANYKSALIAELKYVWDNYFRHNPQLIIILCGSAPSFMLDKVVHSRALYNRSQYEIHLRELDITEAKALLHKRQCREVFDAYLTVGGIPEYLKRLNKDSSVYLSLCQQSFLPEGFFLCEYEKIFTSGLADNKHYRQMIALLSQQRFMTRKQLMTALKLPSGGTVTQLLTDLEKAGFIEKYHPFNLGENTLLARYAIADNYLQYYFKFIHPLKNKIQHGDFKNNPMMGIKSDSYAKWLGFAFERWCRKYHTKIATILGFSAVQYNAGVFFNRGTEQAKPGYQIDLVFDRMDNVYTICEIKYLRDKVGTHIIPELERKCALFPNKRNKTIHKVLICTEGADQALLASCYFDNIITYDQFFDQ
jgi:uncharacterized protein